MTAETGPEARAARARTALREAGGGTFVLAPGPNFRYLSGFETEQSKRHTFLVLPAEGEAFFFVPSMFADDALAASWVDAAATWDDEDDPAAALADAFADRGVAGPLYVNERMWTTFSLDVRRALAGADGDGDGDGDGDADADLRRAGDLLAPLRMVKEEPELAAVREASSVADAVSRVVRGELDLVGETENAVAAELEYRMRRRGATGASFETIVASGPNSGRPAYRAGDRTIEAGDPLILDFGCVVDGYLSDQTRSTVVGADGPGDAPEGYAEAHAAVLDAQDAAVAAVEPGVEARAVDAAARAVLDEAGYGDLFPHVTGHGVGLDIHEPPFLVGGSYLGGFNEVELEPGMVFSVEPAVYTDDWGIRVEDLVVVTETGAERLNGSPYGWEPL
jgi:Xaa-Pro aminopeptidase